MNARSTGTAGLRIDGKLVRKFIFMRQRRLLLPHEMRPGNHAVEVEAFDKDHAIKRLEEKYPHARSQDWEFVDELEPEQFIGVLGDTLPFLPFGSMLRKA